MEKTIIDRLLGENSAMIDKENLGYSDGANRLNRPRYPEDKEYMNGYTKGFKTTEKKPLDDDYTITFSDGKGGLSSGKQLKLPF